ncbi:MAG: class I SAM-dependent methyltransferase [Methanobrevibacter sp.]|nr:class I SAM-dependent methyltransferase [Methanobrevibacter sp.]
MSDYSYLSKYYDSLTGNVDYDRRADFLVEKIKLQNGITVLDAGCGTGSMTKLLLERGFDLIGVDNSPEMLTIAREKNPDALLLCQDLSDLDLYGTVQCVICLQDTLNHIKDLDTVAACIDKFSLFLEQNCLLIFDINSLYKHQIVLGNNSFVLENDNVICAWRNEYNCADDSVRMQLDLFYSENGKNYLRNTEIIKEIYISQSWIEKTLDTSGFIIEEIIDGDRYIPTDDKTERIMYIARKK